MHAESEVHIYVVLQGCAAVNAIVENSASLDLLHSVLVHLKSVIVRLLLLLQELRLAALD